MFCTLGGDTPNDSSGRDNAYGLCGGIPVSGSTPVLLEGPRSPTSILASPWEETVAPAKSLLVPQKTSRRTWGFPVNPSRPCPKRARRSTSLFSVTRSTFVYHHSRYTRRSQPLQMSHWPHQVLNRLSVRIRTWFVFFWRQPQEAIQSYHDLILYHTIPYSSADTATLERPLNFGLRGTRTLVGAVGLELILACCANSSHRAVIMQQSP